MTWHPPISLLARHSPPSYLARHVVLLYSLVLLAVSLYPFKGWQLPNHPVWSFLFFPFPYYDSKIDDVLNVLAYIPFGAGLMLSFRLRVGRLGALVLAMSLSGIFSFVMETLQVFLPTRVASNVDILTNVLGGGLGAMGALAFASRRLAHRLALLRQYLFREGAVVDYGMVVIGLWFVTQLDPSIPLFGVVVRPQGLPQPFVAPIEDPTFFLKLLECLDAMLKLNIVALLVSLVVSQRRFIWRGVAAMFCGAVLIKMTMAGTLLKPIAFFQWVNGRILLGVWLGLLLLLLLTRLRSNWRATTCLLLIVVNLAVDWLWPLDPAPKLALQLFKWQYVQLLNFNGMAQTIADLWPALAAIFLVLYRRQELQEENRPSFK